MSLINDRHRATFAGIADVLIPEAEGMPSASQAEVPGAILDRVVELRSDLREAFFRGLNKASGQDPQTAIEGLDRDDPEALGAIGLLASAAYYMQPQVRALIGYPGQENRPVDAESEPAYIANGMLQEVIDRGSIYRPTPEEA
ncbi:MAG: hypothetical protein Kilf2KO_41890 [Rhodospirillales bacterium]